MPPYNDLDGPSSGPARTISAIHEDSFAVRHKLGSRQMHRPAADVPSASSSGSWVGQAFPNSHPGNRHRQQQAPMTSNSSIVSGSVHPHIRELVERQQQKERQQHYAAQQQQHPHHVQQHMEHERREKEKEMRKYQRATGVGETQSVIKGLHMEHVLNNQYHEGAYLDDHTIKTHRPPGYNPNPALGSPHNQPLGSPMHAPDLGGEDYVIQGTFQNKGCACQTADDVGYLFGCGTHPQDEVVYVYNTNPEAPKEPPTAMADERNLFYHRGPENEGDVHDIMFQIDREYQAMQAHHANNMHGEFLRDPPPGVSSPRRTGPPHGHYRVEHEDDEYTRASCSMRSLMDLIFPGKKAKKHRDRLDYPTSPCRNIICSSPRKRKPKNVSSSNDSQDGDNSISSFVKAKKVVKNASDSVAELQSQLKAMVHERARRQAESPKPETRQEPTPPASPSIKDEAKEREVEVLRKEQANLDQARRTLEVELAAHRQNVAAINAGYNQQMLGGVGVGGLGVSPTAALGVQPQMVLSPLTAPTTPMMVANTGVPAAQPFVNGMAMNNGLWSQQPQIAGMAGMQQSALNMMQGAQVQQQAQQQAQDAPTIAQSRISRPPMEVSTSHMNNDATSVMGKSMMSHTMMSHTIGGLKSEGKFIDNVGGGFALRPKPVTPSQARSPTSRYQQQTPSSARSVQHQQWRTSPRSRGVSGSASANEFAQNNSKLNDLKIKNAIMRQDISRMRECMDGSKGSPNNRSRPFPRTSPPSSPGRDDPVARAMRRSDEARSVRGSGGSVASGSLKQYHHGRQGNQQNRENKYSQGRRSREGYSSRRQPLSPMRTHHEKEQEYYHV